MLGAEKGERHVRGRRLAPPAGPAPPLVAPAASPSHPASRPASHPPARRHGAGAGPGPASLRAPRPPPRSEAFFRRAVLF